MKESKLIRKQWDKIYKKEGMAYASPLDYLPKLIKLLKKRRAKRILDLGCGSGNHMLYLAKQGFEVYGIDIAEEGIEIAKERFKKGGLRGSFKLGSIHKNLPYKDNFFDAIVSLRVLNHGRIEEIRKTIREIERVLKPQGLIFITVIRKPCREKPLGVRVLNSLRVKMIGSRTYIPLEGREIGLVHYLFNKNLLRHEFSNFKIHKLWIDYGKEKWEHYYCLFGERI